MSSKHYTANTIEDLVQIGLTCTESKFELREDTARIFADKAAGEAWQTEVTELRFNFNKGAYDSETFTKREAALFERRPEMILKESFRLVQKTSGWTTRYVTIELSPELGKQIDSVWTKVQLYPGSSTYVPGRHGLTLKSLLARLGKTDLKKQIAAKNAQIKAQNEKNARNYTRREIAKAAKMIQKLMADQPDMVFPASLAELAQFDEMQEA